MKKWHTTIWLLSTFFTILICNTSATAIPCITISPATDNALAIVNNSCPTFSWSATEGAEGYKIAVFAFPDCQNTPEVIIYDDLIQVAEPIFTTLLPAPALSWTPPLSQSLLPGQNYVWFVCSLGQENLVEWSNGALFKVSENAFTNLDDAINNAVTAFLSEDGDGSNFWLGLENRIEEIVTSNNELATLSSEQPIREFARSAGEEQTGDSHDNCWYGSGAGYTIYLDDYDGNNNYALQNVFIGVNAGWSTDGGDNASVDLLSDKGDANTFVGYSAGLLNSSGYKNAFFGHSAGYANLTGNQNLFAGQNSGHDNTTGSTNCFLGYSSGEDNTTGYNNTYLGALSGANNNEGAYNVCIGYSAGAANKTTGNIFIGSSAGSYNTNGSGNVFIGTEAGGSNVGGFQNVYLGTEAGTIATSNHNTFVGYRSGYSVTDGHSNTLIGHNAGQALTTGHQNTMLGKESGYSCETGNNNTFVGYGAGYTTTGSGNVFIGTMAGILETGSNKLYISNGDRNLITGDFSSKQVNINGTLEFTTAYATSDKRWKKEIEPLSDALSTIQKLNGVSYLWKQDEFPEKEFSDDRQVGLIAQDVEKILPEVVKTDEEGYKSIAYSQIVPVLIEAVKSQQKIIDKQQKAMLAQKKYLQSQIDELKFMLEGLVGTRM